MRRASAAVLAALLLVPCATAMPAAAASAPPQLTPWGPSWTELRLEARKGILKGSIVMSARRVPAPAAATDMRPWPEGAAREPDGDVLVFQTLTDATFRGRASRTTWADARGLLQDDGRDGPRRSIRRFGAGALFQWKERGSGRRATNEEKRVALDQPEALGRPVVDFASLLWLATARRLDREGASLHVAVVSKGRLVPLDLRAGETAVVETRGPAGASVTARRVRISPGDPEHESTLLGLKGDIDLWLDTASGTPVQLDGRVAKLGAVRVRVTHARFEPAG